jgi:hypothetical protein
MRYALLRRPLGKSHLYDQQAVCSPDSLTFPSAYLDNLSGTHVRWRRGGAGVIPDGLSNHRQWPRGRG